MWTKTEAIELAIIFERKSRDNRFTVHNQLDYKRQLDEITQKYNITYEEVKK